MNLSEPKYQSPKISLCIPTYNRQLRLEKLLDGCEKLSDFIDYELFIRDNASLDRTEEMVKSRMSTHPNWHYTKNATNNGGFSNIHACTTEANSKYLIIIGDDEVLTEDAGKIFADCISIMERFSLSAFLFSPVKMNNRYDSPNVLNEPFEWIQYLPINYPAFISAVIWRTEIWQNFRYFSLPKEYSMPQLHLFIETCTRLKVGASSKIPFLIGEDEDTSNPGYWFFRRAALVDCVEIPVLYRQIRANEFISFTTKMFAFLKHIKHFKHIAKKLPLSIHNKDYYQFSLLKLISYNHTVTGFILLPILYLRAQIQLRFKKIKFSEKENFGKINYLNDTY